MKRIEVAIKSSNESVKLLFKDIVVVVKKLIKVKEKEIIKNKENLPLIGY